MARTAAKTEHDIALNQEPACSKVTDFQHYRGFWVVSARPEDGIAFALPSVLADAMAASRKMRFEPAGVVAGNYRIEK
jgi:hypothetical protein